MMDGPMTITMDLHQQILAASRETVLQEAADVCNNERKEAVKHQMPIMALGALACRRQVEALRATPAPVLPAVRIAELEAALKSLVNEVHSLEVFEHAIRCGIGNTNFACIQNAMVNARAALSTQDGKDTG
jgi:hypothetical protein